MHYALMKTEIVRFAGSLLAAGAVLVGSNGCQNEHPPAAEQPKAPEVATNAAGAVGDDVRSRSPREVATNASPNAAGVVRQEFQKLTGKWLRPDGGYVLDLKTVSADGKFEAGYFNPSPIHVSKAVAIQEGPATRVFVELRDVNYPGCTYSLAYDAKTDQLYGQYYQAAIQQTFDVTFGRLKE